MQELFYLLADSNDQEGVVTAAALAVELQAGGLTEEHVDFVRHFAGSYLYTYIPHQVVPTLTRWLID